MELALGAAGLAPEAIDYVNLHGTGTPSNDAAEDVAVHGLFGDSVPVNSTKGMTGHALGAAGALEALLSVIAIEEGRIPGSPGTRVVDPKLRARYEMRGAVRNVQRVLSNSFGFGGSNCSLVFGARRRPMTLAACVEGIGLVGPGLAGWPPCARRALRTRAVRAHANVHPFAGRASRRRAPPRGKGGPHFAGGWPRGGHCCRALRARHGSVFTSSTGDGENVHAICEMLASNDRMISPTRFHNSVHNAPSGYWGIATGAQKSADSLAAFDASFGAGMMEAMSRLAADPDEPVLLIAYDAPYPEPLNATRPIPDAFAVALALSSPQRSQHGATITLEPGGTSIDVLDDSQLEDLRRGIPAARSLPLLRLLALEAAGRATLEYLEGLPLTVRCS